MAQADMTHKDEPEEGLVRIDCSETKLYADDRGDAGKMRPGTVRIRAPSDGKPVGLRGDARSTRASVCEAAGNRRSKYEWQGISIYAANHFIQLPEGVKRNSPRTIIAGLHPRRLHPRLISELCGSAFLVRQITSSNYQGKTRGGRNTLSRRKSDRTGKREKPDEAFLVDFPFDSGWFCCVAICAADIASNYRRETRGGQKTNQKK
ncbi:hypothetical protein B0H16DRAFT_1457477 [Mycena metata]|uniref:Uncharacterized protein n=1 Tax=Mycena metata TaxID=1033252 RepID=A0AAD7J6A8_9AGAR|nr:hypothetical protein B0H16DRAFT_1457477 [Mycena metata]